MGKTKKFLSLVVCTIFILAFLAGPALAKGARGGGFSSGGRSSFSSGAKGFSSQSGSYGSKPSAASSGSHTPTGATAGTSGGASAGSAAFGGTASPSGAAGTVGGGTSSYGKGYSTDTSSFSTPRQNSPPTLHSEYSTGRQGYATGTGSYSTGTGSYSGSWNRETFASGGLDKFPSRPPVGIFGSPPQAPYYYHNQYWGLPLLARMFFQPNFYWTPWGYHFFAPRLLTWIVVIILAGAAVILIRNRLRANKL